MNFMMYILKLDSVVAVHLGRRETYTAHHQVGMLRNLKLRNINSLNEDTSSIELTMLTWISFKSLPRE